MPDVHSAVSQAVAQSANTAMRGRLSSRSPSVVCGTTRAPIATTAATPAATSARERQVRAARTPRMMRSTLSRTRRTTMLAPSGPASRHRRRASGSAKPGGSVLYEAASSAAAWSAAAAPSAALRTERVGDHKLPSIENVFALRAGSDGEAVVAAVAVEVDFERDKKIITAHLRWHDGFRGCRLRCRV